MGVPFATGAQEAAELKINSTRYIVIDANTGHVFAQRGAQDQVAIASLTKVFTAVQALEMAPLDTIITTSDFDLRAPDGTYMGTNGTLMGFGVNEEYTLEDMLYGMLLPSGNDAANAIARSLGARPGDSDEEATQHFMDLLNQRIADMGLANTHLITPSGWGVEGHYSSAADVAAFNRFVMHYPRLLEIMGTQSYTTSNDLITVSNSNRSLNLYPSVTAGKTGYDWEAGYCLINFASRDNATMIAVTLDGVAPDDWYDDNATLLDYGFEQQSALAASGAAFEGDVLGVTDPSAAQVARSVQAGSGFVPATEEVAPTSTVAAESSQPPAAATTTEPAAESSSDRSLIQRGTWVVVIAAVGLLGVRGLLAFRNARKHVHEPRVQAADRD